MILDIRSSPHLRLQNCLVIFSSEPPGSIHSFISRSSLLVFGGPGPLLGTGIHQTIVPVLTGHVYRPPSPGDAPTLFPRVRSNRCQVAGGVFLDPESLPRRPFRICRVTAGRLSDENHSALLLRNGSTSDSEVQVVILQKKKKWPQILRPCGVLPYHTALPHLWSGVESNLASLG